MALPFAPTAQPAAMAQNRATAFLPTATAATSGTAAPFTAMSGQNVSEALSNLRLPLTEGNVSLATSMVENGISLSKENIGTLKSALAQLPPDSSGAGVSSAKVGAAWFLTQNQLPVTGQNVALLSNFIANHPQLGQQLFQVRKSLSQSGGEVRGVQAGKSEAMSQLAGMISELVLDSPQKRGQTQGRGRMMNMAKQLGIGTNLALIGTGEQDWDLLALMRSLRGELAEAGSESSELAAFLKDAENNIGALRLLNGGHPDSEIAFYYMQIPLRRERDDHAEIWIRYRLREDGRRVVDSRDTHLDFCIFTERLGEIRCSAELADGRVYVDLSSASEDVCSFINSNLVVLRERLRALDWQIGHTKVSLSCGADVPEMIACQELNTLEALDVQA
ncbi:hypothetical protein IJT17_01700 [bacterium]|nr:hypothetical protein [bacterium]